MNKRYHIVPYPAEYVIYDEDEKRIAACPTEQEANEYIEAMIQQDVERAD